MSIILYFSKDPFEEPIEPQPEGTTLVAKQPMYNYYVWYHVFPVCVLRGAGTAIKMYRYQGIGGHQVRHTINYIID